jgi:hypothetical protein
MTTTNTVAGVYADEVAHHRTYLLTEYENSRSRHEYSVDNSYDAVRHDVPALKSRMYRHGGSIALTLAAIFTAAGITIGTHLGHQYGSWGFAAVFPFAACCWALLVFVRGVRLPLSYWGTLLHEKVFAAAHEIARAATEGRQDGRPALAAFTLLRPALEELLEQEHTYSQAHREAENVTYKSAYAQALADEREKVQRLLVDITAEVTATAALLFARRGDLLVPVAHAQTETLANALELLSLETQLRLLQARQSFAAIFTDRG